MKKTAAAVLWILAVLIFCGSGALGRDTEVSSLM